MTANPYDQPDTCFCSAWSENECACGGYVDRGKVRAWNEGYAQALADATPTDPFAECTCGHYYYDHIGDVCSFYGCGCGQTFGADA